MWEHRFAGVNGIRLHYVTAGQGKLMLFLHGFPEFWYAWKDQLREFGTDHRAVALDMRGYNLSSKPKDVEQYAMPFLVEDVRALADQLLSTGLDKKLIVVGHDWGGVVAWIFATDYPDYVDKLVIINAPHPAIFARELRGNPEQRKASSYMRLFCSERAEETLTAANYAALQLAVFEGSVRPEAFSGEDRRAYREAWAQPGAITGGLNYYRASRAADLLTGTHTPGPAETPPVRVPTLVIWGEKDPVLLPGNLRGLEELVPNLRIRRIPDGSHWVVHEFPEVVNRSIREFLLEAE